jgi:hypothetical protein
MQSMPVAQVGGGSRKNSASSFKNQAKFNAPPGESFNTSFQVGVIYQITYFKVIKHNKILFSH